MHQTSEEFDRHVRRYVYDVTLKRGYPPSMTETSADLETPPGQVRAAFQRLAAGRVLVLQRDTGEILMANPFSAVPTPFLVELDEFSCYGNCVWDALGIPAMLKLNGRIRTSCGCCGTAMELTVHERALQPAPGLIHFAVPALRWWDDITFT